MDAEYRIQNMSGFAAEFKDITLDPSDDVSQRKTRRVIRAKIVRNTDKPDEKVNITLVHQRRHSGSDEWQDYDAFNLPSLRNGQEAKIHLDSAETHALLEHLQDLYEIAKTDVPNGRSGDYFVIRKGQGAATADSIKQFLSFINEGGEELWQDVLDANLKIPSALALQRIHEIRSQVLDEFENHMLWEDWDEQDWQQYFTNNEWIFGHGLDYRFLETVTDQPYYGGKSVNRTGGQQGDFLMATQASARFTVLVEIKRPDTLLLTIDQYRNRVYGPSTELSGGIAQLQSNCHMWATSGSLDIYTRDELNDKQIYTYEPKGILVIGNTSQLGDDREKRASFELHRRNLHNPEVLTFDELFARAKFLVNHSLHSSE